MPKVPVDRDYLMPVRPNECPFDRVVKDTYVSTRSSDQAIPSHDVPASGAIAVGSARARFVGLYPMAESIPAQRTSLGLVHDPRHS